jgi:hypothetical protein
VVLQLKDFVFVIDRDGVWQHREFHLHENAVALKMHCIDTYTLAVLSNLISSYIKLC